MLSQLIASESLDSRVFVNVVAYARLNAEFAYNCNHLPVFYKPIRVAVSHTSSSQPNNRLYSYQTPTRHQQPLSISVPPQPSDTVTSVTVITEVPLTPCASVTPKFPSETNKNEGVGSLLGLLANTKLQH
ncbi:hypothetical protein RB195_024757 [Necator americanus]|uniref:Uncharacterized protein n=1 Tax=Necator americanus TaxID=51031 RepID=A0ABR1EPS2_NECAM